jgi:hypothetical protein
MSKTPEDIANRPTKKQAKLSALLAMSKTPEDITNRPTMEAERTALPSGPVSPPAAIKRPLNLRYNLRHAGKPGSPDLAAIATAALGQMRVPRRGDNLKGEGLTPAMAQLHEGQVSPMARTVTGMKYI